MVATKLELESDNARLKRLIVVLREALEAERELNVAMRDEPAILKEADIPPRYWQGRIEAINKALGYPQSWWREMATSTERHCKECGQLFRPEGAVVCDLDKILCVPCTGAALSRITG